MFFALKDTVRQRTAKQKQKQKSTSGCQRWEYRVEGGISNKPPTHAHLPQTEY